MARMLAAKGLVHESQVLARYEEWGRNVHVVPERGDGSFEGWVAGLGDVLSQGHDVIFQMPFVQDGVRGVADFLERVDDEHARVTYEPVDAKLARGAAKPGHVLQLCLYAEAIAAQTGRWPRYVHIEPRLG